MAITNPNLEDGFDLNGSNLLALTTALKDDGFSQNEIPKSGHMNTVFKELYRYVQFLKETGISQWDNTASYKSGARIMRDEVLYKSLSDANQGNDPLSAPSFWQVDEWRQQTTTHNITVDGDYTLTATQNSFGRIIITDTGVVLTGAVNIIADDLQKSFIAVNNTAQDLTFKTSSGAGFTILPNSFQNIYNNGLDVIDNEHTGVGVNQTWVDETANRAVGVLYTNTKSKPRLVNIVIQQLTTDQKVYVDGLSVAGYVADTVAQRGTMTVIVPAESTYLLNAGTLLSWSELK